MFAPSSSLVPPVVPACDLPWPPAGTGIGFGIGFGIPPVGVIRSAVDPDDDEDLPEDDLPLAEPADEESNFDDFDDEFDDDFEEEENDPDWDHGDEDLPEPPPAKGPGGKK